MDLSKISDIKELKAMAFDELAKLQQAQGNIQAINQRLAELAQKPQEDKSK